jgi:hypothetical protein
MHNKNLEKSISKKFNTSGIKYGSISGKTFLMKKKRWLWLAGGLAALFIVLGVVSFIVSRPDTYDPPEAEKILMAQQDLDFGILIPAYLPKGFDRKNVELKVTENVTNGEPLVEMMYRFKRKDAAIHIGEWVPANPQLETLFGSKPIETRWGKGYLLTQGKSLITVWVDVGQLRVSASTASLDLVSREQLVRIAETMGLASNLQVYQFYNNPEPIKGVEPPPPFIVPLNSQGVQELNLTITPGGYSPMRFQVKKDIPVKINFRALGEVGCGNVLIYPANPNNTLNLTLESVTDLKVLEYVPQVVGDFQFQCTTNCYRGVVTVSE